MRTINITQQAFVSQRIRRGNAEILFFDLHRFVGAVQNNPDGFWRDVFDGRIQCKTIFQTDGFYLIEDPGIFVFAQRGNTSLFYGNIPVGKNFLQVNIVHDTQSIATRTGPIGRIKRKEIGFRFIISNAGGGTHHLFAVMPHIAINGVQNHHNPFSLFHGCFETSFQTIFNTCLYRETIYNRFNIMYFITIELHSESQFTNLSIHAYT